VFPDGPKVGDKAPALHLAKLLNAPTNAQASWPSLKGKVVVLDFWATWCPPCIASIPHMNTLVDELKDEPVQFIAITAEPEDVVAKFLKKNPLEKEDTSKWPKEQKTWGERITKAFQEPNPIHAWIGLDDLTGQNPESYYTGSTVTGYFFQGVPHCVVVDANGIIAAYLHPLQLNAQFLKAIAAGEHPPIPDPDLPPGQLAQWRNAMKRETEMRKDMPPIPMGPTMLASIRRSREWEPKEKPIGTYSPGANTRSGNVVFRQSGVSLTDALKAAGDLSPLNRGGAPMLRCDILSPLPTAPHDFNFSVPPNAFPMVFSQAIEAAFNLDIRRETVGEEIFRVGKSSTGEENPKARQSVKESANDPAHGKLSIPSSTGGVSANFILLVQEAFGKKLVYDYSDGTLERDGLAVTWDPTGGFDAFKNALRDQMGLQIKTDKLTIEVLHIRTKVK
jgi:thiol-disulfide isomerase/thioredoxin